MDVLVDGCEIIIERHAPVLLALAGLIESKVGGEGIGESQIHPSTTRQLFAGT
jgi:hypothetical protein